MQEYVLINAIPHEVSKRDFVLLVLKDRPDWQKGRFNLVGGHVENDEKPYTAAVRELQEESGLYPHPRMFRELHINSKGNLHPNLSGKIVGPAEVVWCYNIVVSADRPLKPKEDETQPVNWYHWHDIATDRRLIPSLRIILPLMMMRINQWTMHVDDSFMNKDFHTISLTVPSETNDEFDCIKNVDDVLSGNRPEFQKTWEVSRVQKIITVPRRRRSSRLY